MAGQLSLAPLWEDSRSSSGEAAALGPLLATERGVDFHDLPCRSILNRCSSERMPFQWTINPYRGCEFGCTYCYARYSHEFLGLTEWLDFQQKVLVKRNAPAVLPREMTPARLEGKSIAIGTVTDPYQPAERRFRVTRKLLEVMAMARGLRVSITTKSALITRDLDLLQEIASRSRLTINVSLITLNRRLARVLEPRAPTPERRLRTVAALSRAALRVGIFAMPVLPGLTDSPRSLDALVRASAQAGARHFLAQLLFLRGSALQGFLPRLAKDFPALTARYRREYSRSATQSDVARDRLAHLIRDLKKRHGIPGAER